MAQIGIIEPFTGSDFEAYQERLEAYFEANEIGRVGSDATEEQKKKADRKMVAHTIAVMGKESYNTLKDCCLPDKPTDKSFADICKIMQEYYKPSVLIVAEAYRFHQTKQEAGEAVSVYANRLRRLAVNCKFDNFLSRALRDQFVCGIRNPNSLKKLLAQDKNFDECLNIAIADEAADKESKRLVSGETESVHFNKYQNRDRDRKKGNKAKCFRCGSESHLADKCSLKNSGMSCSYCNKSNHTSKECFKKRNDENRKRRDTLM